MKVIIPSKDRPQVITQDYFKDAMVVVHNKEQESLYKNEGTRNVVVSNTPYGVSFQRQWIIDNLVEEGEWFITADDNIRAVTRLEGKENVPIPLSEFMDFVREDIEVAERMGANYCGFAVVDNYYFREKKYRAVGYVISKLAMIKNVGVPYDTNILAMDDYGYTAENLLRFGKVLIDNRIYPEAQHYQEGGIGTYEERLPKKIKDCRYLMSKYPKLFRYKKKAGCHPKAEIQIRFTSLKQVQKWREEMMSRRGGGLH